MSVRPRRLLLASVNADPLPAWPVAWGVPFTPGELRGPEGLAVADADGRAWPTQLRALAHHPDGSVSRLLVTAEPPVPAVEERAWTLAEGAAPAPPRPAAVGESSLTGAVGTVSLTPGGVAFDTPHGKLLLLPRARGGVSGDHADLEWRAERVERYEHGPVAASAVVHGGMHRAAAGEGRGQIREDAALLHLRLTLRVFAATPVLFCDVLAKNLSAHAAIEIDALGLRLVRAGGENHGDWTRLDYEVRQVPERRASALPFTARAGTLRLDFAGPGGAEAHTSRLLSYNETWFSPRPSEAPAGIVLGVRNFYEQYPYGVAVERDAITAELWPSWHGRPWRLAQGCGRTHELAVGVLPGGLPDAGYTPRAIGYAHGKPPLARVAFDQLREAPALADLPDYRPGEYPRLETTLYDLAFNRNRGYGKMNHGDDYSPLYTNQLRGEGEIVWNNLEGDYPYHMFCQFARTGRYFYFKEFLTSLGHWMDVDFCDRSNDPLREGTLIVHSAGHVSGGASPCHNWAEGFKEWYFATGHPRGREVLEKIAGWLLRQDGAGFFKTAPEPYVRGCGWGLLQIAAIQEVLARPDLERLARRLCDELLAYCRAKGGLAMTIPTGGTWRPRDNAFHTATVVMGAYACWKLYAAPAMRELALLAAEALVDERTCTPEGLAVYISGPEQDFPMQQACGFALAGLAVAYYLGGDRAYVRRGMRMLEYLLDRGMVVDHGRIPGEFRTFGEDVVLDIMPTTPNSQLLGYQLRGLLMFMRAAQETGMLKAVEYKY